MNRKWRQGYARLTPEEWAAVLRRFENESAVVIARDYPGLHPRSINNKAAKARKARSKP